MKLGNHIKYVIVIGLAGIAVIGLLIFVEYKSISAASENQAFIVLKMNTWLYILYVISILLIAGVFTLLSYAAYNIIRRNNEINAALRISEERFRTIFKETPLGIALIDAYTGIIWEANPKYMEILGIKEEELGAITWMSITHPDDLSESMEYKKKINENKLRNFKLLRRYKRPDNSIVWGSISVSTTETKERAHGLYLCTLEDVTEQIELEKSIKEGEDKYRSLVDNATDIIITIDLEDKVTFINYAAGVYTKKQLIGASIYSFVAPEYYELVKQAHIQVKNRKKPMVYETVSHGEDGVSRWFLTTVSPNISEDKVVGLTLYTKDITKRKQMEEALRASENELRGIFAVMEDIIFEIDSKGKYLKIAPTNPSLLYKAANELSGKTVSEIFPEEQAELFLSKVCESLQENKVVQLEYNLEINGSAITFEASVSPLTNNSVLWIARDITERKRIDEERIKNQQNFEDAQRLAKIGSWELSLPTYEANWSKEMYRILELDNQVVDNLYGAYKSLCYPEDLSKIDELIKNAIEQGVGFSYEHPILCRSGKIKHLSCIGEAVKNSRGEVIGLKGTDQDITEMKKMQDLLKLEALFNGSNDAIMMLTRNGFFDCNPKTLEMFGLTNKNEFTESHPSDLSPLTQPDGENSYIKANKMIDIAFEKGVNRFEWLHRRKNGEVFPAEVKLSAFNYGDKRVLQATVHDITERKLAEKKLKESESIISSVLQTLPVAVFGKDIKKDFQFSIWNKKAEEIFGLKAEECMGKTDYDFFSKQDADWYRKKDIEASKTNNVIYIPEEVVESKNKRIIVRTKKTVVRDIKGEPLFLLGVSEDITEQKEVEEKIRKSEEKYRSVVENAADIIVMIDDKNSIQFVNRTREGVTKEQVLGVSIFSYIPAEYEEQVKEKLKKIYETKQPQSFEVHARHSDGAMAWYSSNAGPIFEGNNVVGITFIIRNITERKIAEEKTRHSLKEKEVLLKEVHHRVKNNLQIILSILNLQYANVSDKKTLELLQDVRSRIKAMSFIHELLYQANDFSSINFSQYISNITTNLVYSYSKDHTVNLTLDVGEVFLDLDRAIPCGLIINELLTNALKYAFAEQEEGEISILLKQTDEYIKLVIADNGKGFPMNIDYRNTESLGMQLVITLVQQLRGEIMLDNSKGAKYIITFSNHPDALRLA